MQQGLRSHGRAYLKNISILHSKRPKLYAILAVLSAVGLNSFVIDSTMCEEIMFHNFAFDGHRNKNSNLALDQLLFICYLNLQGPVQLRFEKLQSGSLPPKFGEVKYDAGPEDKFVSTRILSMIYFCVMPVITVLQSFCCLANNYVRGGGLWK